MRLAACLSLSILVAFAARADDSAALISQATLAYDAKEYAKAAQLYEAAIKAGANGSGAPYNAACCYSLLGRTDDAFHALDRAIAAGWRDPDHMQADTDLESLRKDSRWSGVVKRCEAARDEFIKSLKEPALREELLKRMKEDQRIRMMERPDPEEVKRIDGGNTAFMKKVIEKHGWPGRGMVGPDGAQAAFLMVQHADADPAFQKKCLELLKEAYDKKEATGQHLAYLTDRVLCAEGKPQRYGTQFHTVDGELRPRPIEDEANLDARRKEMGLEPMEDYARRMRGLEKKQP